MQYRFATSADIPLLAEMNYQLAEDERNPSTNTVAQLGDRMAQWLASEYTGVVFEQEGSVVAYAVYRISCDGVYLRQFFVHRTWRRKGIGRRAMDLLLHEIWPHGRRITLEVLAHNERARKFWQAVGFADFSLMLERWN